MNQAYVNAYCQAKEAGQTMQQAFMSVVKAGGTMQEAQSVCWGVEKGTAAPFYGVYADGREHAKFDASNDD